MYGWHFCNTKLRDGSPIPKDGAWLPPIKNIVLCKRGYHGSAHPIDALRYAPGSLLTYCEYRGAVVTGDDKFCASERRIICRMDADEMLRYFARMQALSVVHLWDAPDVVLDYLATGAADLRAAAGAAAGDAAWAAAWDAARAAAWAAAGDAAGDDLASLVYECFESVVNPDGSPKVSK